jgi:DNA-binding FrmR family transcriptional regulator
MALDLIVSPPILWGMAHTIREKSKLLARVRRIGGQVEAVERALEAELGCADVLQLIASVRGAVNSLMAEVMEDHIRFHVVDPARERDAAKAKGAEELIDVVRAYLK